MVSRFTSIIEKIWKKDIQAEFVIDGYTVNFVQVRELPKNVLFQAPEVQFPDEPPIHSGAAIGIGDMELPVLDNQDDNSDKTGIVVFSTNEMFSMGDNSYRLPKEGAVVISRDTGMSGHIQTLCAERGLICIFPDVNEKEDMPTLNYYALSSLKNMRIVTNGFQGRVYRKQQEDSLETDDQNEFGLQEST
jgi:hypothetical protein